MSNLTDIYSELYDAGIKMFARPLYFSSGSSAVTIEVGGDYGIFLDTYNVKTQADEAATVAHEAGHIFTGSTHPLYSPYQIIKQHENRADKWAIKKLVPKHELEEAVKAGYTEVWELAEFFSLPEPFIRKAVHFYKFNNMACD